MLCKYPKTGFLNSNVLFPGGKMKPRLNSIILCSLLQVNPAVEEFDHLQITINFI